MEKIKKFDEFVNEGMFKNLAGMAMRSIGKWAAEPLNDMIKDIKQSGDPKEIINSLKTYVQKSGESINDQLKKVKTIGTKSDDENSLYKFLNDELLGLHTALKGVQATQKVSNTYFEEIFKKADKGLVKAMSSKRKAPQMINDYVGTLIGNLKNIAGVNESFLFEAEGVVDAAGGDNTGGDNTGGDNTGGDDKEKKTPENPKDKKKRIEDLKKLKGVTQKWLTNILSPIMKSDAPQSQGGEGKGNSGDVIQFDNGQYKMKRSDVQGMVKKASFKNIEDFRKSVGGENEFPISK